MKNDQIIIFGASEAGLNFYDQWSHLYNIKCFMDNDPNKWGKKLNGIDIVSPDVLESRDTVFVASMYYEEIEKQLLEKGLNKIYGCPIFYVCGRSDERYDGALKRIKSKLERLEVSELSISNYSKKYLDSIKKNLSQQLQIYKEIIQVVYTDTDESIENTSFLDYGGGTGILGCLAKELGIKRVYYSDIYDVAVKDARTIATELGYELHGHITGDETTVAKYFLDEGIQLGGIGSYDVLEHIYDVESFFNIILESLEKGASICMATSANSYNPKIVERLIKVHDELEYRDRADYEGHKQRDALDSYFKIRKKIIKNLLNQDVDLENDDIVELLAKKSRGLNQSDIELVVKEYIETGKMNRDRNNRFPSNTCDPYTGNWGEQLIDYDLLVDSLTEQGVDVQLLPKKSIEKSGVLALLLRKV
ncbi:50S ribosomal protein L11 methyltransferase [Anoxynatronum buryatiense]|uniref:Ribosomal protein L11 methyltransferase (PrmA) n=1 Tax=Anoxynatronum buryatiense TaxID=489973 RepID=A0AA45WVE1_9CLOT|nr:50S ribosomal protein L11 methyltransferase [Anoxynatronum buryatiense]SMP52667.1 Ribosomal protein L11 methyltransferase (PrmA) [Anoxynatronum buryatiense]